MGRPSLPPIRSWPGAGSEPEPTETPSAATLDDPSRPGSPKPPASDSDFDSNRDSNGGGRPWNPARPASQSNDRPRRSRSMTQFLQLGLFGRQAVTRDDIRGCPAKPTSNRGPRNLRLTKQVRIAGFPDHLSNAVVVGASGAERRHHGSIGRPNTRRMPQKSSMNPGASLLQRLRLTGS